MKYKQIDSLDFLIVHCSATKPDQDIGRYEIDKWHRTQNNWLEIGYHFVIRRDGTLEKGRPEMAVGAHAYGFNRKSMGICLVGGINSTGKPENNFTEEQFETLRSTLSSLQQTLGHCGTQIVGHRDLPRVSKACPCFDVKEWWYQCSK